MLAQYYENTEAAVFATTIIKINSVYASYHHSLNFKNLELEHPMDYY